MYTYGYLREAVMAHCDLEEDELQAMNVLKRLHIFANEAMQAVCACKPKYKYFKIKAVEKYRPIGKKIINNKIVYFDYFDAIHTNYLGKVTNIQEAIDKYTPIEKYVGTVVFDNISNQYWIVNEIATNNYKWEKINLADDVATKEYYTKNNIYELNTNIRMPDDFISFTNKQTFKRTVNKFNPENFIYDNWTTNEAERLEPVNYNKDIMFSDNNSVMCLKEGEYLVPYKCVWYLFTSALPDTEEIDMPIDILNCLPLYIASVVLQIDYAQKAQIKRSEFELALSRVSVTDNMPVNRIKPSF
jgi:hypothetical protein